MALETRSSAILSFGTFEVDLRAGELRRSGFKVRLQEQPLQFLSMLLEKPGEIVTREELRNRLWPADTFVDFDHGLNAAVKRLRDALGDSAESPRYVETVARRGYRFIAPVNGSNLKKRVVNIGRWKIVATVVIVVAAAVAAGLYWRSRRTVKLTDKDTIVLADFDNFTGDDVFDGALKQALAVQLAQSPFLNILPERSVEETLQMMGRSSNGRLTRDVALELCLRTGSKAIVLGSISKLGNQYVIGLDVVGCRNGETLDKGQEEAATKEEVLQALSKGAVNLRAKLGESLASVQKFDVPIGATTSSLEALKAYSMGKEVWGRKGDVAALQFMKRAVELDPNFASAYLYLGVAYYNLGELALTEENLKKAYTLRDRVSLRERYNIEGAYSLLATGDIEQAIQVHELWAKSYPQWVPHSHLGGMYWALGQFEKAVPEIQASIQQNPDTTSDYFCLASAYLALNRPDDAQGMWQQAQERKLDAVGLRLIVFRLAFLRGDATEMKRQVDAAAGKPGVEDVLLSSQSDLEAYYGRLAKARDFTRRAVDSAFRNVSQETASQWYINAALREAEFGNVAAAKQQLLQALALGPGRDVRMYSALTLARIGETLRAKKIAEELENNYPSNTLLKFYWLPTVKAAIELKANNPTNALEFLDAGATYEPNPAGRMYFNYIRGQAQLMVHDGATAATEFQKILDHRGIVLNEPIGALAHLQLGRAYALQGDSAKARAAYRDFLTLWKDADPDIPVLKQAKAEYARMQ